MGGDIELNKYRTYPKGVNKIKEMVFEIPDEDIKSIRESEYISDYIRENYSVEKGNTVSRMHIRLIEELNNKMIVGYHNTRLLNVENIKNEGLIFSDARYLKSLEFDLKEACFSKNEVNEILELIKNECLRQKIQTSAGREPDLREKEVCFYYDQKDYKKYDRFYKAWGGEFAIFALYENDKCPKKYKILKTLGAPYIVKFMYNFDELDKYGKDNLVTYLIEQWINKEIFVGKLETYLNNANRIEKEIPPENIIEIIRIK